MYPGASCIANAQTVRLQLRSLTNCNLTDQLQLDVNQLQLDGPIATQREPIATRPSRAATRREPVATKRLTATVALHLLQLDGNNYNEYDSVALGHEPIATRLLVATRREQIATRMSSSCNWTRPSCNKGGCILYRECIQVHCSKTVYI
jgi:hypothetical protein